MLEPEARRKETASTRLQEMPLPTARLPWVLRRLLPLMITSLVIMAGTAVLALHLTLFLVHCPASHINNRKL